jgi:sugar porter (SP) family MFS transporter
MGIGPILLSCFFHKGQGFIKNFRITPCRLFAKPVTWHILEKFLIRNGIVTDMQTLPRPFNPYFVYFIATIGALGGILFGFDTGIIAGALLFIDKTFPLSTLLKEVIASSVILGAFTSSLCSGRLADRFGRRGMLMLAAVAFIMGSLLTTFAYNIACIIAGRIIIGLAIGVSSYTVPLFISEMAPAKHRGALVLLNAIMITGGQAAAFLVAYYFSSQGEWRYMFAGGLIPAILLFIGMLFAPSSPRWLVLKGATDKARATLQRIRPATHVETELTEIKESFSLDKPHWKLLFSKQMRPVLIIGLGLGILQQAVGINTVMYYGPTIFQHAGFQSQSAQILATFGMGLVNTIMSIVGVFIVDKIGRRKLLLTGTAIAGLSLLFVGMNFYSHAHALWLRWVSLVGLVCYIAGYCISVGSLFWLIISEIYPLNIRSQAMSFVTAAQWGANFIVTMTFLSIIQAIGPAYTLWLYAGMCIVCFLFTYNMVPETSGVSLETIERNLELGKPSRELGQPLDNRHNNVWIQT